MFDPNAFLNATTSQPMSTSISPVPEGEWTALISDGDDFVTFRQVDTQNGPRPIARVSFRIVDEACRAKLGRDDIRISQDLWLDVLSDGVSLDTGEGRNVKLGQLRAALRQNDGSPWSWGKLRGAGPLIVRTTQRSDKNDPSIKYSEVSRTIAIT